MKTLITGALKYNKKEFEKLKEIGLQIIYIEDETKKIEIDVSDIEFVICNSLFLYNDIKIFKSLKVIQLTSAGLDRVPLDYIDSNNIKLYNARGVYSIPMSEWTILKILEIYKKSKEFWIQQEKNVWQKNREILELNEKVTTIIGFGSVGKEIAKRLQAFNVKIIAVDLKNINSEYVNKCYKIEELDEAIINSDIVILTLPLTKQTEGLIDRNKMALMKNDSILVNIARGKLIKEDELINFLREQPKKFLGVVLDVFENEPLDKNSELWKIHNVTITPHNSFIGDKNQERLFDLICNNIIENKGII